MYREANQRGLKPQPEPVNIIIAAIEEVGVPANSEVGASKRPVLAGVLTGLLLFLALVIVLWVAMRAFSAVTFGCLKRKGSGRWREVCH